MVLGDEVVVVIGLSALVEVEEHPIIKLDNDRREIAAYFLNRGSRSNINSSIHSYIFIGKHEQLVFPVSGSSFGTFWIL